MAKVPTQSQVEADIARAQASGELTGNLTYDPRQLAADLGANVADPPPAVAPATGPQPIAKPLILGPPRDFRILHIGVGPFEQGRIVNELEFPMEVDVDRLLRLNAIEIVDRRQSGSPRVGDVPEDFKQSAEYGRNLANMFEALVEQMRKLNGNLEGVDLVKLRELSKAQVDANNPPPG